MRFIGRQTSHISRLRKTTHVPCPNLEAKFNHTRERGSVIRCTVKFETNLPFSDTRSGKDDGSTTLIPGCGSGVGRIVGKLVGTELG